MSGGQQVLFLADAHLRGPGDENQRALVSFLRERASRRMALVILGDLFDFMAGFNRTANTNYREILSTLDGFSPLYYIEGNHDFDLCADTPGLDRASIWPGPANLTIDGSIFRLMHGDRTSRMDFGTRMLRRLLQGSVLRFLRDHLLSDEFVFNFALAFANLSRLKTWPGRMNESATARARAIEEGLANGATASIFAHTHKPLLEQVGDLAVANPGPAVIGGSYLQLCDGRLSLHRFPDGEMLSPGPLELSPTSSGNKLG
jgi:UDP-2,3-diacylglucosamine hydrolase